MKPVLDVVHGGLVYARRVARLATLIAERLPENASVLDVGTGDGKLAATVHARRNDITIKGVDVLARPQSAIPVELFDGRRLPFPDASVDAVMCVDVLHHADDAPQLLAECGRVARSAVIVKDHLCEGVLAESTLRLMDWVGNARHGVSLPYHYFTREEWRAMIARCRLRASRWDEVLRLYPIPLDWIFGRRLHVLATLVPDGRS
jgi:SAM-dependent methyltransferase